jgi:diguanylate cyclase (GGDEF)-like protein
LGGDEFLAVMPVADAEAAVAAAGGFIAGIEDVGRTRTSFPLSASIGIATGTPSESAEQLLHRADQAMYRAKAFGRGRCEFAGSQEMHPGPSRGRDTGPIPVE